jgi:hypothetical protein
LGLSQHVDGWSEKGVAFLPRLESDTHQSQFATMMGFAKGSTHPAATGYWRDQQQRPTFQSSVQSRNDSRKRRREVEMDDRTVRVALERHWDASDASDFNVEHEIYHEDAVLDYPQSGERIRGRHNIQESRFVQPNKKRFTVRRMIGGGDLWVTEFVLSYDGTPSYVVSIMQFREGLVAHETQYFADRFDPGPSRAHLVERMG